MHAHSFASHAHSGKFAYLLFNGGVALDDLKTHNITSQNGVSWLRTLLGPGSLGFRDSKYIFQYQDYPKVIIIIIAYKCTKIPTYPKCVPKRTCWCFMIKALPYR